MIYLDTTNINGLTLLLTILLWIVVIGFFSMSLNKKRASKQNTIDHYISKPEYTKEERKQCQEDKLELEDRFRRKNAPVKKC